MTKVIRKEFEACTFLEAFGCIDIEPKDYTEPLNPIVAPMTKTMEEPDLTLLDPENLVL